MVRTNQTAILVTKVKRRIGPKGLAVFVLWAGLGSRIMQPALAAEPIRDYHYTIGSGWSLVHFPFSAEPPVHTVLEMRGLSLWTATSTHAAKNRLDPEKGVAPGRAYWVHAPKAAALSMQGTPTGLEGPRVSSGWNLVGVSRATAYADPNIQQILTWDRSRQSYRRLPLGTVLEPERGYWVLADKARLGFDTNCLPNEWTFFDAVTVLDDCPFSLDASEIRSRQGKRGLDDEGLDLAPSENLRVTLGGTGTESNLPIEALQAVDAHYVIAQDQEGGWHIYGEPRTPSVSIRIVVAGTYEPIRAADYEETQFGFDLQAPEAARQPPRPALLRLAELVSHLSATHPHLHLDPSDTRPLPGHIIDALRARFLAQPGLAGSIKPPGDEPAKKPHMVIRYPSAAEFHTRAPSVSIRGEVSGKDPVRLALNGVTVKTSTGGFSSLVFLEPGENLFDLSLVDASGRARHAQRKIVRDVTAPVVDVVADAHAKGPKGQPVLRFHLRVREPHLERLSLNGETLPTRHTLVHDVLASALPAGQTVFAFRASDKAGHNAESRLTVNKKTSGEITVHTPTVPPSALVAKERPGAQGPMLSLDGESQTHYLQTPTYKVRGHASGTGIQAVAVNGVHIGSTEGPFEVTLQLDRTHAVLEVAAYDRWGQKTHATAELIFDPDPPVILINGGESQQMYHANPIISGLVEDANLEGIWFRAGAEGDLEPLQIKTGRFEFPVVLHDGVNTFELVARDRAGHETIEPLLVQFESVMSELKTPMAPSRLFATLNAPSVRLHWSPPLVFDDGTPIPEGVAVAHPSLPGQHFGR